MAHGSEIVSLNETLGGGTVPDPFVSQLPRFARPQYRASGHGGLPFLPASLGLPGNNQRLWGYLVTGNYFDMLGVTAARGRLLKSGGRLAPGRAPRGRFDLGLLAETIRRRSRRGGTTRENQWHGLHHPGSHAARLFRHRTVLPPEIYFPTMMQKELEGGKGYLENRDAGNFFAVAD